MGLRSRLSLILIVVMGLPIIFMSVQVYFASTRQQASVLFELDKIKSLMEAQPESINHNVVLDQVERLREVTDQLAINLRFNQIVIGTSLALVGVFLSVVLARLLVIPFQVLSQKAKNTFLAIQGITDDIQLPYQRDDLGFISEVLELVESRLPGRVLALEKQLGLRAEESRQLAAMLTDATQVIQDSPEVLDLDRFLGEVINQITTRFYLYHTAIYLLDRSREYVVLRSADRGAGSQRMVQAGYRLRVGREGIIGSAAGGLKPVFVVDIQSDARNIPNLNLPAARAELVVPLVVRGVPIGVLDLQATASDDLNPEKRNLFELLANQIAYVIENHRLVEEARQALASERRAYTEITRQGWKALMQATPELGYLANDQGVFPVEGKWQPWMEQALELQQPVVVKSADFTTVSVPIRVRDEILGVMDFRKNGDATIWSEDDLALIQTLADQLGQALESARLYQNAQLRAERERIFSDVTAKVRASTNVDTILQTAVKELADVLHIPKGSIQLHSGDGGLTDE